MLIVYAFATGLIFGIGLILAGMANPAKVLGFLDIAGNWDPSLAFVMLGAIGVAALAFYLLRKRGKTLLNSTLFWPLAKHIDRPLIVGAVLFGSGWGLAGICPGPALVLLGSGVGKGVVFLSAMFAGMVIFEYFRAYRAR